MYLLAVGETTPLFKDITGSSQSLSPSFAAAMDECCAPAAILDPLLGANCDGAVPPRAPGSPGPQGPQPPAPSFNAHFWLDHRAKGMHKILQLQCWKGFLYQVVHPSI